MYLLKNDLELVTEIKKSVFHTLVVKTETASDFEHKLSEIKKQYPGATHYVYAYKIQQNFKFSDDKEPGGSAGFQIYSTIKNLDITNFAVVIIRFYGGIKLGLTALTRTYKSLSVEAIKKIKKVKAENYVLATFRFKYSAKEKVLSLVSALIQIESKYLYKDQIYAEIKLESSENVDSLKDSPDVEMLEVKTLTFYVDVDWIFKINGLYYVWSFLKKGVKMGIFKKITLAFVLVLSAGFMFACKNTPKPNPAPNPPAPAPAPTPQPDEDGFKKMSIKQAASQAKGTKIHVEGYYVNVGGYNKIIDGEGNALNLTFIYAPKGIFSGDKVSMKATVDESQYGKEIAKDPKPVFTKLNDKFSAVDISNRPASQVEAHENKIVKFTAEIKEYKEETRENKGKQYAYITVRVSIADTDYEIKYDGRSESKSPKKPILKALQELKGKEGINKTFEGLFLVKVKGQLRFTPTRSFQIFQ